VRDPQAAGLTDTAAAGGRRGEAGLLADLRALAIPFAAHEHPATLPSPKAARSTPAFPARTARTCS
jgi:hypothetical protein